MSASAASPSTARDDVGSSARVSLALVRVADHLFGFELDRIREIARAAACTPIPGCEPYVRGLANLRGRIVTVVDLGGWIGEDPVTDDPEHCVVVLEVDGRWLGVAVAEARRVVVMEREALRESRASLRSAGFERAEILGVGDDAGGGFVVLDAGSLVEAMLA